MNLLRGKTAADYVNTGEWAKKAIKRGEAATARSTSPRAPRSRAFTYVPPRERGSSTRRRSLCALHCANETIGGVEFHWMPDIGDVPLVADMSSHILSRPLDVSRFGADLRRRAEEHRPGRPDDRDRARRPARPRATGHAVDVRLRRRRRRRLDAQHAAHLRDLHRRAGVPVAASDRAASPPMEQRNIAKAALLYDYLDEFALLHQPGRKRRTARG